MKSAKIAAWVVAAAASAALPALAETVTVNAPAGTSTNVTQVFSGATTVTVNTGTTGGTVRLSPHSAHTGGTTLSSGTLDVQQESQLGGSLKLLGGNFSLGQGIEHSLNIDSSYSHLSHERQRSHHQCQCNNLSHYHYN